MGNQLAFSTPRVFTIKRTEPNSILVGSNLEGYLTLFIGENGKLDSINGIGSSLNIKGRVMRNMNFDSLVNTSIASQHKKGIMQYTTRRDSVMFSKGSLKMKILYWRPSVRGRKIFGAVVPYNRFWRTGANNATVIEINKAIYFAGKKLDKGKYSIFTMPDPDHWTLMFNKQTDIWGTDYNPQYDVLKVPMKVEKLPSKVETLTIELLPKGQGGMLSIAWENTRATVDFK